MIIPPLVGLVTSRPQGLELRYTASYLLLLGEHAGIAIVTVHCLLRSKLLYSYIATYVGVRKRKWWSDQ